MMLIMSRMEMRKTLGLRVVLVCLLFGSVNARSCSESRRAYGERGYSASAAPLNAMS
ncbi:glypican-2, partial [Tachysurus ichikawai]